MCRPWSHSKSVQKLVLLAPDPVQWPLIPAPAQKELFWIWSLGSKHRRSFIFLRASWVVGRCSKSGGGSSENPVSTEQGSIEKAPDCVPVPFWGCTAYVSEHLPFSRVKDTRYQEMFINHFLLGKGFVCLKADLFFPNIVIGLVGRFHFLLQTLLSWYTCMSDGDICSGVLNVIVHSDFISETSQNDSGL